MKKALIFLTFLLLAPLAHCETITCATPTFSINGGLYNANTPVTISCATAGATIHYTIDGSTPSATDGIVASSVTITNTCTLQAIASAPGYTDSDITSAMFMLQCSMPVATPSGGPYTTAQTVSLQSPGAGTIRYTLDGSTPTAINGIVYTAPFIINTNCLLRAQAYQAGWLDSSILASQFLLTCTDPSFNIAPDYYASAQHVTISTATPGATVRYTLDGTQPSETYGMIYTAAIPMTAATTTLRAIAYVPGWVDSSIISGTYMISDGFSTPASSPVDSGKSIPHTVGRSMLSCQKSMYNQYFTTGYALLIDRFHHWLIVR